MGSKLLTVEFLCTMQTTDSEVTFRLFGKDFSVPWKQLSELLGFNAQCVVDIDYALKILIGQNSGKKYPKNLPVTVLTLVIFITLPYALCING